MTEKTFKSFISPDSNVTALSPREMAGMLGASESSIRRWIDQGVIQAEKTVGGHRRIPLAEVVSFLRSRGIRINDHHGLGLMDLVIEDRSLHQLLLDGSADELISMLRKKFLYGRSLAEIIDEMIAPEMARVGELWKQSPEGIAIEHRATQIVCRALLALEELVAPVQDAPVAIGGACEGSPYQIASLCTSVVLTQNGWQSHDLGSNMPSRSLINQAVLMKAKLVWIAIPPDRSYPVQSLVEHVRVGLPADIALVAGGRPEDKVVVPGVNWASTMREFEYFLQTSKDALNS